MTLLFLPFKAILPVLYSQRYYQFGLEETRYTIVAVHCNEEDRRLKSTTKLMPRVKCANIWYSCVNPSVLRVHSITPECSCNWKGARSLFSRSPWRTRGERGARFSRREIPNKRRAGPKSKYLRSPDWGGRACARASAHEKRNIKVYISLPGARRFITLRAIRPSASVTFPRISQRRDYETRERMACRLPQRFVSGATWGEVGLISFPMLHNLPRPDSCVAPTPPSTPRAAPRWPNRDSKSEPS